ncbi:MAG TPA: hypothetical protein ENN19_12855 [Chloroflexi bacterium]|nr:hypothetical protein [Chloroflexota bacterium]
MIADLKLELERANAAADQDRTQVAPLHPAAPVAEEVEVTREVEVMLELTPEPMAEEPVPGEETTEQTLPPVTIREQFADTAFWEPLLVTDRAGRARVTVTLPDNLTTWVMRGVGLTADTVVGERTVDLVATKPLLVRPVTPRFFVAEDRARLAANVNNNTDEDLLVDVSLIAEGVRISPDTPHSQPITIAAHSEGKATWDVTVADVPHVQLTFSAVSGTYADAAKPRLTTGPAGSLPIYRYSAPDIVGTAGQLVEGGSRTETILLPDTFDDRRGQLTLKLDTSLATSMQDGLKYLRHYPYKCTEQTVSRFLPNVLTFHALESLGIERPQLAERLPGLVGVGLEKLYREQNPDGGWGWWYNPRDWHSNPYLSAYVVFSLVKAQQAGIDVSEGVLAKGIQYLQAQVESVDKYGDFRNANRQTWLLYVLAEGGAASSDKLDELFEHREQASFYARAYLAQALWLNDPEDARLVTLLSDLNNAAIFSATGAHWEENKHDWWAMNTDTRSTAIVIDTLTKLDPENATSSPR